jgi:hypothetical protein
VDLENRTVGTALPTSVDDGRRTGDGRATDGRRTRVVERARGRAVMSSSSAVRVVGE